MNEEVKQDGIELAIRENDNVVETAVNLIDEHYGPIQNIVIDTPGIVESEKELRVNSQQKYKVAADCLGLVKGHLKIIEDRRKICLKPFKTSTDLINTFAKKISGDLKGVVNSVENKIRKYDDILQEEKRKADAEAMRKAEEAAKNNEPIPIEESTKEKAPAPQQIKTKNTTVSMVDNWKCEVVDEQAFIKYAVESGQFELIQINQPNLNRLVKMVKNSRLIPGVKVFNHKSIPTRSK